MSTSTSHEHAPGSAGAVDQFLSELRSPSGDSLPLELLSDLDRSGAQRLADGWSRIPDETRTALLRRMVEDAEQNVDRLYGRAMRIALADPDPDSRLIAIEGLWEYDVPGLLEQLLDLLNREPDDRVRAALALALAAYVQRVELGTVDPGQARHLVRVLLDLHHDDPSLEVRRRALESVGYVASDTEVTEAVRDAYMSGVYQMQVSALRAMGHQASDEWLPTLYEELRSDEPEIRYEAVTAIGMIMNERSSSRIVDMLADDDTEVSAAAINALGSIGGPIAINSLRRIIREESDELLLDAAQEALDEALLTENPLRPPL